MKSRNIWLSGHLVIWLSIGLSGGLGGRSAFAQAPRSPQPDARPDVPAGAARAAAATPTPAPPPTSDVKVETSVDRTAIWVADRVVYSITITCKPNVDVLDDDLAREKLKLDGLEIVGTETSAATAPDGTTTHHYRYTLTTYHLDTPTLSIAPLTVRYYVKRPGQRLQDASPAGEVAVPGAAIAFRSMLPDAQEDYALRDGRPAQPRARLYAIAQPVGLGLVVASIVPAGFWAIALVAERRRRGAHKSIRQAREQERASLEAAQSLDVTTVEGRREAYSTIDVVVRAHLKDVCGVAGPSLTPAEVGPALAGDGARVPVEVVTALLTACETARYAPVEQLPSAEACRQALEQAAQVLAAK